MAEGKKGIRGTQGFAYVMTAPTVIILLLMTAYPVVFTVVYSFTDYNYLKGTHTFIALENYVSLFQNI